MAPRKRRTNSTTMASPSNVKRRKFNGRRREANIRKHFELFSAIANNNTEKCLQLLNAKVKSSGTLLHCAVHQNRKDIVEELLLPKWNTNINAVNRKLETPLHIAALKNYDDLVNLLLKYNARTDLRNDEGETFLDIVRKSELRSLQDDVVVIKDEEEDSVKSEIDLTVSLSSPGDVYRLSLNSAESDEKPQKIRELAKNETLISAAKKGRQDIVQYLLDQGKKVNYFDENLTTPLHTATRHGHHEIVRLLIDRGANIDTLDKFKRTPLQCAAYYGHKDAALVLIEKGQNVDTPNDFLRTPLHQAAKQGYWEIVKILIDNDAELDVVDEDMRTPLHCAAIAGHKNVVQLLATRGANIDTVDIENNTPFDSVEKRFKDIARFLIHRGARISDKRKRKLLR